MTEYLLDTMVIIDYLRGLKETVTLLKRLFEEDATFGCCAITVAEVYSGMRDTEKDATEGLINSFDYYDVTKPIAKKTGLLRQKYKSKGKTLPLPDVLIAAIAIEYDLTLITDNIKHYPISGLKLIATNS